MEPVILALEEKYDDEVAFIIADLNDPETKMLLEKFTVRYIPAFFYIDKSGNIVAEDVGRKSFNHMDGQIKTHLLEEK